MELKDPAPLTTELADFRAENEEFDGYLDKLSADAGAPPTDIDMLVGKALKWEAKAKALEAQYAPILESLNGQIKHAKSKAERAKFLLQQLVPNDKETITPYSRCYWKRSLRTEVTNIEEIPLEYISMAPEVSIAAINSDLARGKEVPGIRRVPHYSLQISNVGGDKGKHLAYERKKRLAEKGED